MRIPLYWLSIMLLQGMKPKDGNAQLESEGNGSFQGWIIWVSPAPDHASKACPQASREKSNHWWNESWDMGIMWEGEVSWSRADVLCFSFSISSSFCYRNSSYERGSHSTPLSPGQPTCPISLATVTGTWQEECQSSLWDLMCGSWGRVSFFTCEIMRWKAVWLRITYQWSSYLPNHSQTLTHSDKAIKAHFQNTQQPHHKQSQLSGHLFAILPMKVVFRLVLPFPEI